MTLLPEHTLILRLSDRPGAMEAIAATFAHRGISLSWTLGNDGASTPDGHATVIVHFRSTFSHKATIQRVLSRLPRIVSVTEPAVGGAAVHQCALVRLASEASAPSLPLPAQATVVTQDPETGETIYALSGPPQILEPALADLQRSGVIIGITQVLLAL